MRHILISGGMGGVGSAIAQRFLDDGCRVTILDRSSGNDTEQLTHIACDLSQSESIQSAVQSAVQRFGTPDACIHCAVEPILRKTLLEIDSDLFKQQFDVSLFGGFTLLTEAAKRMKEKRVGYLISITSSVTEINAHAARMGAYTAAKFALRGLMRELAHELAPFGIHVHAIAPSLMKTGLNNDIPEKIYEVAAASNPMQKNVEPKDIASLTHFLCSSEADALNGLSIPVTYGGTMNL